MYNHSHTTNMSEVNTIERGRWVIRIEANAVRELENRIGKEFDTAIGMLQKCNGRVIISGLGKSGLIARKIVATMNSTGTPSIFLHPSDAVHGDLGMVREEDVAIIISKSGNTEELKQIVQIFKRIGVKVIAMLGNLKSFLAEQVDVVLDVSVKEEACPFDLAPTASTTATLAMGDALAITLLHLRGFTAEDFALFHPGGTLGKRLLLRVDELMAKNDSVPIVHQSVWLRDAIIEMTTKRLGATGVVDDDGLLVGIITDGDLRRLLVRDVDVHVLIAADVMTKNPKTVFPNALAVSALEHMEQFSITQLIVVDPDKKPVGMIHLHELVKAGLG